MKTKRSDRWRNKWVGNGETEYQDKKIKDADSKDKVKHNEKSDQLFLEKMMTVAEQM